MFGVFVIHSHYHFYTNAIFAKCVFAKIGGCLNQCEMFFFLIKLYKF